MLLPKKIFIFSSLALIVVLIFWGIYMLSFKKIPDQITALKNTPGLPLPIAKNDSQIEQVTNEAILSPALSLDGEFIKYYSKTNGRAYALNIFTQDILNISNANLSGLSSVSWSPDRLKVISEFSSATGQPKFFLYNYSQNKGTQLKNNLDTVVWQNNEKIFYKYFDAKTQERTLNISNPDGSHWQKITDLTMKDVVIAPIPKTGLVSFWNKADAFTETQLQSVPVLGGEKRNIVTGKFGADYSWSPDGNSLLLSSVDVKGGSKLQLGTTNSLGGEYKNLGIPTLISKCVWSKTNKTVYYALPGSIPDGMVLPNDYINNKFNTNDTFWKVDLSTGEKSRLVDLEKITIAYDATNLFLSSDESLLFFINRIDGKLYEMSL